ncbi:BrnT family toxin, partial [candidate division CSSED10-310 bacterium]
LEICIIYVYNNIMRIIWDPDKAKQNFQKHKIRFSDAELVLFDPNCLTIEDKGAENEHIFVSIGMDAIGRIIVVVYSYRDDDIRLISARRATKKEIANYERRI